MFRFCYPTVYLDSPYTVDFQKLYQKGFRGLLVDVDNTLVEHGAPSDERSEAFFKMLQDAGWRTCIVSNNHRDRIEPFARQVHSSYIFDAGKPKTSGYLKGMELMGTRKETTVFIGDQMFTDICGANRTGIPSILVTPVKIDRKPFILLKRAGEAIVRRCYLRYAKKHPPSLF